MKNTPNKFLLIEDNKATNFINKTIIKKTLFVDDVLVAENGEEALTILRTGYIPEIIFLDINMPIMNGWEFLMEFQDLNMNSRIVVMIGEELTDSEYATLNNKYEINTFNKKILDKDSLNSIMNHY
jgi:response regulator of citrate/malate metabolism